MRHQVVFNVVKSFTSKNLKIARETLNIEPSEEEGGRPHEWRRLVGSIRRRVQRHASTSGSQETPTSTATTTTGPTSPQQSISRKNSLTQSRFVPTLSYLQSVKEVNDRFRRKTVLQSFMLFLFRLCAESLVKYMSHFILYFKKL